MKRKFADRPDWSRILEKKYGQGYLNDHSFKGHFSFLYLQKVREPLYVKYDAEEICIVDHGFIWMMHFPDDEDYSVTTTFDREGQIVQWYFDVIKSKGLTAEGIPYIDDLYLDFVYLPNGQMFILDEDELQEALSENEITKEEYSKANETLLKLIETIKNHTNEVIRESRNHFEKRSIYVK